MRRAALVVTAVLFSCPAFALDLPPRKPGLWEMTWRPERSTRPLVMRYCVDAATDKALDPLGTPGARCFAPQVDQSSTAIAVERSCHGTGYRTTSRGTINGSFDSAYKIPFVVRQKLTAATVEIRPGGPVHRDPGSEEEFRSTLEATWLGPCAADQRPGDMIAENGSKENIVDLQNTASGPGK